MGSLRDLGGNLMSNETTHLVNMPHRVSIKGEINPVPNNNEEHTMQVIWDKACEEIGEDAVLEMVRNIYQED